MRSTLRSVGWFALVALLVSACAARAPIAPARSEKPGRALDVRDFAPAAGLRWLVFGRPAAIASNPELSRALSEILPPRRLDAYAASTGADLRRLPRALVAGYDFGTLYLAELPAPDGAVVRERFLGRLVDGGIVKHPRPGLFRLSGTEGDVPRALVSVDDRLIAAATGDLTLARVVEAYARERLRSPTALRGAALSTLPAAPDSALATFYAPGPFEGAWAAAVGGLLAPASALSIAASLGSAGQLAVTITLAGDWANAGPEPQSTLERSWVALAQSSTGRLLALDRARNLKSTRHLQYLTLSMEIPTLDLTRALHAATTSNIREIFDVIPQATEPALPTTP